MPLNRLAASQYIEGILSGDRSLLSRAITIIESRHPSDRPLAARILQGIMPHTGNSLRVGITGVPGVGKSTFIEALGKHIIDAEGRLAVLAIDPSSQRSKGSIMGDKTRMETLAADKRAFIRPAPTGTTLGGVSSKTRETMLLCEAAGYNVIFVETVGVGQSETVVYDMVDFFLLLMLAGAGDELQGIKKGIIEMADGLAITKADHQNILPARQAAEQYRHALHYFPANASGWQPFVLTCSAEENKGLDDVWRGIRLFENKTRKNGFFDRRRQMQNHSWMKDQIRQFLESDFYTHPGVAEQLDNLADQVSRGELPATVAAEKLITLYKK